jgi:thioredoxin-related protein
MINTKRMICAVLLLSVACLTGCGPVHWESSLEAGLSKAANERRPALVMFGSVASPDCMEMDRDVFEDPDVQKVLKLFVPVRLEYVLHGKLAKELGVQTVPTFVVYRPDRTVAGVHEGKMDVHNFTIFLIKYRYY